VCQTRFVTDEEVQAAFVEAFNSLVCERVCPEDTQQFTCVNKHECNSCSNSRDRAAQLERHRAQMDEITDTAALDRRIAKYTEECEVVAELIRKAVDENARIAQDQDEYEARHNALIARYEAAKAKADEAQAEKRQRDLLREQAAAFFAEVEGRTDILAGFEEQLWNCTVKSVTVLVGGGFRVRFKDELEVEVPGK
jgi:hypothetical protein